MYEDERPSPSEALEAARQHVSQIEDDNIRGVAQVAIWSAEAIIRQMAENADSLDSLNSRLGDLGYLLDRGQ